MKEPRPGVRGCITCPAPALEICGKVDGEPDLPHGGLRGYLAVFGNVDRGRERILKGAFKRTLKAKMKRGVPLMVRHFAHGGDVAECVGHIYGGKEDDTGLLIDAAFDEDAESQRIRNKVAARPAMYSLSVGYMPKNWHITEEDGKTVINHKEMELLEGTITLHPMNTEARIADAKSDQDGQSHDDTNDDAHDGTAPAAPAASAKSAPVASELQRDLDHRRRYIDSLDL
jgi:HK97 family phage prohead protease